MSDESGVSAAVNGGGGGGEDGSRRQLIDFILKIALASGAILAAIALIGYFLIYTPMRDHRLALEREQQAQLVARAAKDNQARQSREQADRAASVRAGLDSCLASANTDYAANWTHACEARGMKSGCSLPSYETDAINTTRENTKARCVEVAKYGLAPSQ